MLLHQILEYTIHGEIQKRHIRKINLKYEIQHEMKNFTLPDGSYSILDIQRYFE